MTNKFDLAFDDAKRHARECFPEESCGVIADYKYIAFDNEAAATEQHKDDPNCDCKLCSFKLNNEKYTDLVNQLEIQYIVHSHPNGPFEPSLADMRSQIQSDVAWAIIPLDSERVFDVMKWGEKDYIPPIIGRNFVHGITDCYSLVRDVFRLGKDKLAEQGILDWPYDPIELDEFPREVDWWYKDSDLYSENFKTQGFEEIPFSEAKTGDCFLIKIRSDKYNHAGVLINNDLVVHHLPQRLSRREPAGIWGKQSALWIRYTNIKKEDENA